MDRGTVRNLEDIREVDDEPSHTPKAVTVALVAAGFAVILLATLLLGDRTTETRAAKDPLDELLRRGSPGAAKAPANAPPALSSRDVSFPGVLSDGPRPTTALAAVGRAGAEPRPSESAAAREGTDEAPEEGTNALGAQPPPPTDRLPVVPLPAKHVLQPSPVVTRPRDPLTRTASEVGQLQEAPPPTAPEGHEGGYQLQVSSFRTEGDARAFVDQLRARGHRAYMTEAKVASRGTWYRVRVGPFATREQAAAYRIAFEAREHVVPFVVPPKNP